MQSCRRNSEQRRRNIAGQLLQARDGSAAVEFAMVAVPFLMMVFAILELGLILVTDTVLENAAIETGRLVRTGQASAQGMTPDQFKTSLCSRMSIFAPDCATRAKIDVRVVTLFSTPLPNPMASGKFDDSVPRFTTGAPGSLMVVRVWYRQPVFTSFLAQGLPRQPDGTTMLTATTAFRNEPPGAPGAPSGSP